MTIYSSSQSSQPQSRQDACGVQGFECGELISVLAEWV